MNTKIITKEQFEIACLTSNGPGQVIKKLGGCDNGTWRRKIKVLQEHFGIKIPKYEPPKKYELIEKECPVCSKLFKTLKGSKDEKTVCSRSCSNTFFRSGENNPNLRTDLMEMHLIVRYVLRIILKNVVFVNLI